MITLTSVVTRQEIDIPWHWEIINQTVRMPYIRGLQEAGKIINMGITVSENGLIATITTEFDSVETYEEYLSNPIIINYHAKRAAYLSTIWPAAPWSRGTAAAQVGWQMSMVDYPLVFSTP